MTSSGGRNETPHWSEDGSRIFFFSDRDGTLNLWEVDAGGEAETGPARKVTDLSVLPAGVVDGQFTITPDGKKAVVMVNGGLYRTTSPPTPCNRSRPTRLSSLTGPASIRLSRTC